MFVFNRFARLLALFVWTKTLRVLCLGCALFLLPASVWAVEWEVAIVFLGADESPDYQRDIDDDILELAKVLPIPEEGAKEQVRLSLYRDLPDKTITYHVEPSSQSVSDWDALFWEVPAAGVQVPGNILVRQKNETEGALFQHGQFLSEFLANIFQDKSARRMLVLWGHGLGFQGMKGLDLPGIRSLLEASLPPRREPPIAADIGTADRSEINAPSKKPLDILWFDSCFMATVEVAFEMQELADFMLASEEAEFSTGAPLEKLYRLNETGIPTESLAIDLAKDFIHSYSFLKGGTQTEAVETSPATISVVDLEKIPALVAKIAKLKTTQKNLRGNLRRELNRTAHERAMEMEGLADIVALMQDLRDLEGIADSTKDSADAIVRQLEGYTRAHRQREALPVTVRAPKGFPEALLVYGYNEWMYGYEGDWDTLEKLPPELRPDGFIEGKHGLKWPFKRVRGFTDIYPFSPGLNRFYFYYVDERSGNVISEVQAKYRWVEKEVVEFTASEIGNPLRFSAYTQSVGERSERYFGLAIFDPSGRLQPGVRSTKFHAETKWGSF